MVSSGSVDLLAPPFDTALRLYLGSVDVEGHNETQITCLAKDNQLYRIDAELAILQSRGQFYAHVNYKLVPE